MHIIIYMKSMHMQASPKKQAVEDETHLYHVLDSNHQEGQEGLQSSHTTEVSPLPFIYTASPKQCKHTV